MKKPLLTEDMVRLDHILEAIEDLMSNDLSASDKRNIQAAAFCFTIIGEASRNISPTFKADYPDLPWREMVDMRNKIVHEYEGLNTKIMAEVIKDELPSLRQQIEAIVTALLKKVEKP